MKRTIKQVEGEEEVSRKRPSSVVVGITKSISACKRCRTKKIKCDHEFPSCKKCARANKPCVSLDPATGRDVPRSYVIFLEDRLTAMMNKLRECGVDPERVQGNIPMTSEDNPCDIELYEERLRNEHQVPHDNLLAAYLINKGTSMQQGVGIADDEETTSNGGGSHISPQSGLTRSAELDESHKSITAIGSIKNNASNSYLGDSSGIPFAKLVFTAVNFRPDSVEDESDEEIKQRESQYVDYSNAETTSAFEPLWLPPREIAESFVSQYFTDSNSQLPVLHREYFLKKYFEPIYGSWNPSVSLASDHTKINTSFKLPRDCEDVQDEEPWYDSWKRRYDREENITLPDKYEIPYFFLNMVFAIGESTQVLRSDTVRVVSFKRRALQFSKALNFSPNRLESLAGTVLVAVYSLMRPNVPGVWYTMGSALRLAVDLGLHAEKLNRNYDPFTRELRRRLFWCVYSLDRQICSYFGRPFGIPEENITARYPSMLDDALITTTNDDIVDYSKMKSSMASPKVVALAMFKVRRLQANIVQVLYAPNGEVPRSFSNLESWKFEMHRSLDNWFRKEVPKTYKKMNSKFNTEFFNLNYWFTKSMLYGLSPKILTLDDYAFDVVYDSTRGSIDVFYKLCHNSKINYTWVTVHMLFMTSMTYLYSIYYSDRGIRDGRKMAENYVSKLLYVLRKLIGTCEAAKNCYNICKVLSAAMIKLRFDGNKTEENSTPRYPQVMSSNSSPVDILEGTLDMPKIKPDSFDVPLDQFFDELERVTLQSDPESTRSKFSSHDSPQLPNVNYPSLEAEDGADVERDRSANGKDGQRIIDMVTQVTTDSIWSEFFNKARSSNGFTINEDELNKGASNFPL
ncbi:hypothetical protein ZYGR_0A04840 [Zygosaccharomyces rouxii]|uniref:Zn(2)-C6 fungal-type domain-containing protein n=1 Tax=Zygosaccharomyces rouxii TaxID=4956 RepID=A0A1Q2ZTN0_ZYGRO|nr:hypothetical protein ZYGR_0A04840 [Zygosaccharomyces rouxii]